MGVTSHFCTLGGVTLNIGIITRNENGWCSTQLRESMKRRNIIPECFSFPQLVVRINYSPKVSVRKVDVLNGLKALIVRPIGRGSLEEVILRMDVLHRLERLGMHILNPPLAIERSVDKYHALCLLEENGLPVPRTLVTESHEEALRYFHELGRDVIVKPVFGSRGIGSTRVSDPEIATRIFKALSFHHSVLYLQEFVPHGFSDIRAFVIGDRVVAAMKRVAENWKTNVSLGAEPVSIKADKELENLALKTAKTIGCKIAGVDILESPKGLVVVEINSQPGWRGLQSVTKTNIADEIVRFVLSELKV